MKAVVWRGIGDIRLEDVPKPGIKDSTDAIVKITTSAICGTDLHMVRGTMTGMQEGTILGHEGVGIIEELGASVTNLKVGNRVVVPSTIGCGFCEMCRSGLYAQCNQANPHGPNAGTGFYGGPAQTGPFNGMQAEYVRVPYAYINLVKLPEAITDDQAIMLSDVFPTGYFGADIADIMPEDVVAVFGAGPVGLFSIASSFILGAQRVIVIDTKPDRLQLAQKLGAEIIDFNKEDPVEKIKELTGGQGAQKIIDAVGVDAHMAQNGPARPASEKEEQFKMELSQIAPQQNPQGDNWHPGEAPSQVLNWAIEAIAKSGSLSIIGEYPASMKFFPIGKAMKKSLTIRMGACNHRAYIPELISIIKSEVFDPSVILTNKVALENALEAYKSFDKREKGWIKVALKP